MEGIMKQANLLWLALILLITTAPNVLAQVEQIQHQEPSDATAYYYMGVEHFKSGRYKEAVEAYKWPISLKRDPAEAHNNLGATYRKLGWYKQAMESFKRAIELNPDDVTAYSNLGYTYDDLGQYKDAIES
jgi:tetratricopeptide (TPR) repeat protein